MRKMLLAALVAALVGLSMPGPALANCTTTTYMMNGRMVTCTQCCYFGNCTVNCF